MRPYKPPVIWHFYADRDRRWKWECIAQGAVVKRSRAKLSDYEACIANAQGHGYIFQNSQPKQPSRVMN